MKKLILLLILTIRKIARWLAAVFGEMVYRNEHLPEGGRNKTVLGITNIERRVTPVLKQQSTYG